MEECAAVSVAAWTQLSLCDTQRADVPSWAFSSPFPSDAAQQPQAALTLAIIKPDAAQHTRAIVREVADQHGAEISVADALARALAAASGTGPGTLITVRFPVRRRPVRPG